MTQEHKDLLLKDLCSRLPYGVWVEQKLKSCKFGAKCMLHAHDIDAINRGQYDFYKPYLFPLSSMTEEHLYELREMFGFEIEFRDELIELSTFHHNRLGYLEMDAMFEWFNRNHFDYRGLIEKGLAIDATNLNIY